MSLLICTFVFLSTKCSVVAQFGFGEPILFGLVHSFHIRSSEPKCIVLYLFAQTYIIYCPIR